MAGLYTVFWLQHTQPDYWGRLPYSHWPMLFGLYNISVYGNSLVLLPPILLSTVVSPETAVNLRSPHEKTSSTESPDWSLEKIKSALELGEEDEADEYSGDDGHILVPTSPGELLLAFTLAVPSLLFLVYLSCVCYRFVCTKNYAEWRSGRASECQLYTEVVQEGAPVCLEPAHSHQVTQDYSSS